MTITHFPTESKADFSNGVCFESSPLGGLRIDTLTQTQLDDAVSGKVHKDGSVESPWLQSPRIRYYMPNSMRAPVEREKVYCCATTVVYDHDYGRFMRKVVGMLQLQPSPYDDNVVWLCFVSVDPSLPRKGVAKQLLQETVSLMTGRFKGKTLERSSPGIDAPRQFKTFVDNLLDAHGIPWTQN